MAHDCQIRFFFAPINDNSSVNKGILYDTHRTRVCLLLVKTRTHRRRNLGNGSTLRMKLGTTLIDIFVDVNRNHNNEKYFLRFYSLSFFQSFKSRWETQGQCS